MPRKRCTTQEGYNASFPARLRKIMEDTKKTQQDVANAIGKTRQAVGYYADGSSSPDWQTLAAIARLFGVSVDWLVGVSEYRTTANREESAASLGIPENFVERLRVIKEYNMIAEICTVYPLLGNPNFLDALEYVTLAVQNNFGRDIGTQKRKEADIAKIRVGEDPHPWEKDPQFIKIINAIEKMTGGELSIFPKNRAVMAYLDEAQRAFFKAAQSVTDGAGLISLDKELEKIAKNRPGATNTETANDQD